MYKRSTLSMAKPEIERVAVPEIISIKHVAIIQKKLTAKIAKETSVLLLGLFMVDLLVQSTALHL
jgi:hypothetical protein